MRGTCGTQFVGCGLGQRGVHVVDGFVDFLRALEAHGGAIDAGIAEREIHGRQRGLRGA